MFERAGTVIATASATGESLLASVLDTSVLVFMV